MFKFKCKKYLFWETYYVTGFQLREDRMQLFFQDGSLLELAGWSKYDCLLGRDYFDLLKKRMEQQAGQAIPTQEVR